MSTKQGMQPGTICWRDLTVENAEQVRDFYEQVVGWTSEPVDMGEYNDFSMLAAGTSEGVAGVCHARGSNAKIPPQWLMYVVVEDVEQSAARCRELGGEVIDGPRAMGGGSFAVVRDPAGAILAVYKPPA